MVLSENHSKLLIFLNFLFEIITPIIYRKFRYIYENFSNIFMFNKHILNKVYIIKIFIMFYNTNSILY